MHKCINSRHNRPVDTVLILMFHASTFSSRHSRQDWDTTIENFTIRNERATADKADEKPPVTDVDVVTVVPTADDIQLKAFDSMPEFFGKPGTYRTW